MADTITLKPAPGRRVKDPVTLRVLAEGGETKPRNSYWLRRLADGDVVEGTTEAAVTKSTTKKQTTPSSSSSPKEA